MFRRVDRPQGEPDESKNVRALIPNMAVGTAHVYHATDGRLVATPSTHDDYALAWYQQHGYIVWV